MHSVFIHTGVLWFLQVAEGGILIQPNLLPEGPQILFFFVLPAPFSRSTIGFMRPMNTLLVL